MVVVYKAGRLPKSGIAVPVELLGEELEHRVSCAFVVLPEIVVGVFQHAR